MWYGVKYSFQSLTIALFNSNPRSAFQGAYLDSWTSINPKGFALHIYRLKLGEYFWGSNFENLYSLGTVHSCFIFWSCQINNKCCTFKCFIFSTVFWIQFHSPSTSVNLILHYFYIELKFYLINRD